MAIYIAEAICTVLAPAFGVMFPIVVLSSTGNALFWPTMGALLAISVSSDEQGRLSGVSTSLSGLTSVFGSLWAGGVFDKVAPTAPYLIGAVLVALA